MWVLLTVALIGLGLVGAADVYVSTLQREHETELLAIGEQFRSAIRSYYQANAPTSSQLAVDRYPRSLDDLLLDTRVPNVRRHLRKVFVDPMTGTAEWGLIRMGDRVVGVHSLSTKAAIKQAGFEPEDFALTGRLTVGDWWFTYPPELGVQAGSPGRPDPGSGLSPSSSPAALDRPR